MSAPGTDIEWAAILRAPRHANTELRSATIPTDPGVYAWFQGEECLYVGKASILRSRLSSHRRLTPDLSRSTLRASVAVHELGVTRARARSRPSVMTPDEIDVVNAWFARAAVAWTTCPTPEEADLLERRLRATWMPPLNLA